MSGVATVPNRAVALTHDHIVTAAPVAGVDWSSMALAANALAGMASVLVPFCAPMCPMPGGDITLGDGVGLTFTVWPRAVATHRIWFFAVGGVVAPAPGSPPAGESGRFTDPSGGYTPFVAREAMTFYAHTETIATRTDSETNLSVIIGTNGDAVLYGVGCWELTRSQIHAGENDGEDGDHGTDESVLASGLPITDDQGDGEGAGYLPYHLSALRDDARRAGIFAGAPFATSSSATFATVFQSPPIGLGRFLYSTDTTRTIQLAFSVRLIVAGFGVRGEIRVTAASGASVTVSFGDDDAIVRTEIAIDAEDLTTSDGRRASRDDTLTVELRRSVDNGHGGGTVYLDTLTGGEGTRSASIATAIAPTTPTLKRPRFGKGPLPHWMSRKKRTR